MYAQQGTSLLRFAGCDTIRLCLLSSTVQQVRLDSVKDASYLSIFLKPITVCKNYRPKFGDSTSRGYSFQDFMNLYGSDPFYSWIGLDTDLMYAAHRAAGGMTSLYRQIGIGCENLFRRIVLDTCKYEDRALARWSYTGETASGKKKILKLDARIELAAIQARNVAERVSTWMREYAQQLDSELPSNGAVFEVRQGYKSKDSKRQNADIDNAAVAWSKGYLPVFAIFSAQIDSDIVLRYRNSRSGILIGSLVPDSTISLYAFVSNVLGFDLADFFRRNSDRIQSQVHEVIETLLSAE